MKRCLTPLIIRGKKIKTSMRYHFIPPRMTIIQKNEKQQKVWTRMWRNWNPWALQVGM